MTHLVVDTTNGLKIVLATEKNFFSSKYAVQFCGTLAQCEAEKKRLQNLTY